MTAYNLGGQADYGASDLLQRRDDEIEEVKRKRKDAAMRANFSPAGAALIGYGLMSVPGAT
jgi:hypothetical protein